MTQGARDIVSIVQNTDWGHTVEDMMHTTKKHGRHR